MEPFSFLRRTTRTAARGIQAGFTLVEMLVVIGIIAVITGVIITGQSAYNQSLLLTDTAYTVAFSVRQAQFYGLSSRGIAANSGTNVVNAGYGVSFNANTPDRYTVFADTSNAGFTTPTACAVGVEGTPERKPGNCRGKART